MEALSSAISIVLVTEKVDGFSVPDTIQENLYYQKPCTAFHSSQAANPTIPVTASEEPNELLTNA